MLQSKPRTMQRCDLFIAAAEPSGDLHGAEILKSLYPLALNIHGIAGPRMRKLGLTTHYRAEDFNVMGFSDVVMALPRLMRLFKSVKKTILRLNPKIIVLIDYPGFHLKLAKHLRRAGYQGKIVQYVCPSVWAWKKSRIQTLEDNYNLLLTIFPFEPKYFSDSSLATQFVGHPLTKTISAKSLYATKDPHLIAIFPGSRKKEIVRNLPIQLHACRALQKLHPQMRIEISVADPAIEPLIERYNQGRYPLIGAEKSYALMQKAGYAIATSGTVTLELALHGVSTVVTYGISRLDQFLATKIFNIDLPHYCIVNIILEKTLYPELIGSNFTSFSLLKQLEVMIGSATCENQRSDFLELKEALSNKDTAQESVKEIIKLL